MNKTIILPIVALVAGLIKSLFHIEVGDELQNQITDGIIAVITLYGIYVNHREAKKHEEGDKEA